MEACFECSWFFRVPVLSEELSPCTNFGEYRRPEDSTRSFYGGCRVLDPRRGRKDIFATVRSETALVAKLSLHRARFSTRQRHLFVLPDPVNINNDNDLIIDSVIAWSFYPKLLVRDGKGWRNVANNQSVSIHPSSVNKRQNSLKWLSYYHIMQSTNKLVTPPQCGLFPSNILQILQRARNECRRGVCHCFTMRRRRIQGKQIYLTLEEMTDFLRCTLES